MNKSEKPEYYFPRNFPTGVTVDLKPSVRVSKEHKYYSDLGDVFIPTTAAQEVPTYGTTMPVPDENGVYTPTGTQLDGGYGLHFSKGGRTLGCLSFFTQADAENFAALSDSVLRYNGSSTLRVY